MSEDAAGFDPNEWAPRLAMEQYLRYRLLGSEQRTDGLYARLRPFVEWCEHAGIDTVDTLRGVDVGGYYDRRRVEVGETALDREMRTLEQFYEFLDDIGAVGIDDLAGTVPHSRRRPRGQSTVGPFGTGWADGDPTRRAPFLEPTDRVTAISSPGRKTGHVEYEIGADESVSTAIVRAASALDGRSPPFMPPLTNVLDPRALDGLFDAQPDGTPRTGGRLSFVYGSCQVILENDEYLTLKPLGAVPQRELTPPTDCSTGGQSTQ